MSAVVDPKGPLAGRKVLLHDMCLRDGMHARRHQFTLEEMTRLASAMDDAGVELMQVTHGDGLGGSSRNYGFSKHTNAEYIAAVAGVLKRARISVLLVPGLGTMQELKEAYDAGARSVHVATHCTEANVSPQHIAFARELGMDTTGFLMMAHLNSPEGILEQARIMEAAGAGTIYVTDSAGYLLPDGVTARIRILRENLKPETELGFHGHHNLGMGIANSIAAVEAGANRIDASVAGLGAGAGNTPLEVFVAVANRMGIETGVDLFKIMDVAEDVVVPMMDHAVRVDRESLTIGYAGCYSTFLLFAKRAAARYGIDARDLLVELGKKKMIAGQEDMIEDLAMTMAKAQGRFEDAASSLAAEARG
ncbi:MAG: 4-hydroxy-2-oxovalerate aldolase [Myxococcales bacterium]|nr:4-hydroxy-2-oxovalerate aldolase [Myxococcales bacterium]MCB9647298.1 4-hydroxy-2-oxovalerate aldolase [Deltaproteobacteria bacterium]